MTRLADGAVGASGAFGRPGQMTPGLPDPALVAQRASVTVVITRPAAQAAPLAATLETQGARVLCFPLIEVAPLADAAQSARLDAALATLDTFDLAIFVSPNAVDATLTRLAVREHAWPVSVPIGLIGPGSVRALAAHGVAAPVYRLIYPGAASEAADDFTATTREGSVGAGAESEAGAGVPESEVRVWCDAAGVFEPRHGAATSAEVTASPAQRYDSDALWAELCRAFGPSGLVGRRVLLVRGDGGRERLLDALREAGASVEAVIAYHRCLPEPCPDQWQRVHTLLAGAPHVWLLTSSEAVRNLETLALEHLNGAERAALRRAPLVVPHARIAAAARALGFDSITLCDADDEAVVRALLTMVDEAFSSMSDSRTQAAPGAAAAPPTGGMQPNAADPAGAAGKAASTSHSYPASRTSASGVARAARPLWPLWLVLLAVAVSGVAGACWALYRKVDQIERQLTARQQASDAQTSETRVKTQQALDNVHQVDQQLAQLTGRLSDVQPQQQSLQAALQNLARNRDDWSLAEVEQTLASASQQLQLTGSTQLAAFALETADARLASAGGGRALAVRQAIQQDLEKLRATPNLDVLGVAARLDTAIALLDKTPLAASDGPCPGPSSDARPGGASDVTARGWRASGQRLWQAVLTQVRSLVQVRRVDHADLLLIAPDQEYYLRANLRLRLLAARLALLARDQASLKADLSVVDAAVARYFDPAAAATRDLHALLREVGQATPDVSVPTLDASLRAVHSAQGRN